MLFLCTFAQLYVPSCPSLNILYYITLNCLFLITTQMAPIKTGLTRATSSKRAKRSRKTSFPPLQVDEASNAGAEGDNATSEPPRKKGRGPGNIRKSTEVLEDRPIIWPIGDRAFTCEENPQEITAAITRSLFLIITLFDAKCSSVTTYFKIASYQNFIFC